MNYYTKLTLFIFFLALFVYCDNKPEKVARWNVSIRNAPNKTAKISTWLSKGERVRVQKTEGKFSHISLAGGKDGYVESKKLALQALVLTSDDIVLLRRPSESSGKSLSAKRIKKGAVAFVIEKLKNEEGEWLKIIGGSSKHPVFGYIEGWIKEGYGYDSGSSLIRSGIDLEIAIQKKDLDSLKKLANSSEPISEMAAAQIVEIEGIEEAPLEEETEVAPQTETPVDETKVESSE